tara:strand:+ start:164 stop:484 length:321 start_codon:yes stop_codon:yes gene_type:complete
MNPLIFSLVCLVAVGVAGNFMSLIKRNKILLCISLIPCIYILIYGFYLILGPVDLYQDGTNNFFIKNPNEKELPIVFVLLKFYQYILIAIGAIFSYLFIKYLKNEK